MGDWWLDQSWWGACSGGHKTIGGPFGADSTQFSVSHGSALPSGKRFEHYVFQNMPKGPFWVFASFRGRGSSVQFNPQAVLPF